MKDNDLGRLLAGLGLVSDDLAPHIRKGAKEAPICGARVRQLLVGDARDQERAIGGLVRAAKAKGWTHDRILAAVKALSPAYTGLAMLATIADDDPIKGHMRDLLARRVAD
jgi:hypothetical protein